MYLFPLDVPVQSKTKFPEYKEACISRPNHYKVQAQPPHLELNFKIKRRHVGKVLVLETEEERIPQTIITAETVGQGSYNIRK